MPVKGLVLARPELAAVMHRSLPRARGQEALGRAETAPALFSEPRGLAASCVNFAAGGVPCGMLYVHTRCCVCMDGPGAAPWSLEGSTGLFSGMAQASRETKPPIPFLSM